MFCRRILEDGKRVERLCDCRGRTALRTSQVFEPNNESSSNKSASRMELIDSNHKIPQGSILVHCALVSTPHDAIRRTRQMGRSLFVSHRVWTPNVRVLHVLCLTLLPLRETGASASGNGCSSGGPCATGLHNFHKLPHLASSFSFLPAPFHVLSARETTSTSKSTRANNPISSTKNLQ